MGEVILTRSWIYLESPRVFLRVSCVQWSRESNITGKVRRMQHADDNVLASPSSREHLSNWMPKDTN